MKHTRRVLRYCDITSCFKTLIFQKVNARARITYSKLVVELVREQRIGQLSEVEFAQRADAVNILHVHVFCQVWNIFTVKLMPDQDEMRGESKCHGHAYKQ